MLSRYILKTITPINLYVAAAAARINAQINAKRGMPSTDSPPVRVRKNAITFHGIMSFANFEISRLGSLLHQ